MISLSGSQGYILCETLWTMEVRGGGMAAGEGNERLRCERGKNGKREWKKEKIAKKRGYYIFLG